MASLDQRRLREVLEYDPATGAFTWLRTIHPRRIGTKAGSLNSRGYVHIKVGSRSYKAHRLAWLYMHGVMPPHGIDHVNGVKSDNRIENLRPADQSQNSANRKLSKTNTAGFKGVTRNKKSGKWLAQIQRRGEKVFLGLFESPEAAHAAYSSAADRLFGEYARAA